MNDTLTLKGTGIWFLCAIFYLYEFLLRTSVGTFQQAIMTDLGLTAVQFSTISASAYLLIYGLMQIPVGMMLDRWGLKLSLIGACSLCALSCWGFAYAQSFEMALSMRMIAGLGSSFGFIALLISVYEWMPRSALTFMIGLSQFVGTLGPMMAAGPLEWLAHSGTVSWRDVFLALGVFGFGWSALIALFVSNQPRDASSFEFLSPATSWRQALKSLLQPQVLFVALFCGCVYFSLEYLSENEGKIFLTRAGLSAVQASTCISLAWIGYALGCPFWGALADWTHRRKPFMVLSALIANTALATLIWADARLFAAAAFFFLGLGASGQSVGFAMITEWALARDRALVLSLNNGMMTFIASLNAPLLALVIQAVASDDSMVSLLEYRQAFMVLQLWVLCALPLGLWALKETFGKSQKEFTYLSF